MRTTILLALTVWAAIILAVAPAGRADDPDQPPPREPLRRLRQLLGQPRPEPGDLDKSKRPQPGNNEPADDLKSLPPGDNKQVEDFRRLLQTDDARVAKALQNLQDASQRYKQQGDRRSYRDWRRAYDEWLAAQRDRQAAATRFQRRWQREHPGMPLPPGLASTATPPTWPRRPGSGVPSGLGENVPPVVTIPMPPGESGALPLPYGPATGPVVPPPPPPQRLPAPAKPGLEEIPDPGQPLLALGPAAPEAVPAPPSEPARPAPATGREL
jgi:hypothetical protein